MRILHLVGQREDAGGILSVIRCLHQAGPAAGIDHTVWVHRDYKETRAPSLDYRRTGFIASDSPSHLSIFFTSALAFFSLRKLLRGEPFDVIHAHTRGGLVVALLAGLFLRRRVLFTNHSFANRTWLYRWAARRDWMTTVVLNPNMAAHYGLAVEPPRCSIIFSGSADRFLKEPVTANAWPSADPAAKLRLVGMGTLVRWKCWHHPIAALAKLPAELKARVEFHLWGPEQGDADSQAFAAELRDAIEQHRLQETVLLRGVTNHVTDALRDGHFVIVASENEPCSVSLMEALALGIPALAARSGGNVDIVTDGKTGLLYDTGSIDGLRDRIAAILNGEFTSAPPAEIRESVRGWAASEMAAKYNQVYEQLAKPDEGAS
ncbi:MAG: glycosyltransferase family 4 protein [Verrucomicrobia bacterium]|nr:glycosyltransferase family 4 protein [Verrucomicrobiota bacterium]